MFNQKGQRVSQNFMQLDTEITILEIERKDSPILKNDTWYDFSFVDRAYFFFFSFLKISTDGAVWMYSNATLDRTRLADN